MDESAGRMVITKKREAHPGAKEREQKPYAARLLDMAAKLHSYSADVYQQTDTLCTKITGRSSPPSEVEAKTDEPETFFQLMEKEIRGILVYLRDTAERIEDISREF